MATTPISEEKEWIWLRFFAAYATLNAPYWLLGQWIYLSRPFFNADLVVPLLLAGWSVRAAVLVLSLLWALDLAVSQAQAYHFTSPLEFLRASQFLSDINLAQWFTAENLAIGSLFTALAAAALKLAPRRRVAWRTALTLVVSMKALDVANGSSQLWQRGALLTQAKFMNSPTKTLLVRAWTERELAPLVPIPETSSATAIADVAGWASAHQSGSVLIVLVESMGWHVDPRMREWLRDQLFGAQLEKRFRVSQGTVPFNGSTTTAELRELCGLYGSYRALTAQAGADCLPARLVQRGWSTTGMHGFSRRMFDRAEWWPLIGLQTSRFAQDLIAPDGRRCGAAFPGVCDRSLIDAAINEAASPRRFVYALTLNSHLPLAPIEVPPDLQQRCQLAGAGDGVCKLTATIGIALRALRDGLGGKGPSPLVVVAGDHAPPFASLRDRNQYDERRVPMFILTPN